MCTGPIEGTGIGLTITRRLAELMGGAVGFRSTSNEGSEFWVDMPVRRAATHSSRPSPAAPKARAARADGKVRLVLYVEDNPANVVFMRDLMSGIENVDLVSVPSAELGVDIARARRPEIIIMDINLPGMSGLDALHALRAQPETETIPVIALTAAASERDRLKGEAAGFGRYLTKPLNVDEFVEDVEDEVVTAERDVGSARRAAHRVSAVREKKERQRARLWRGSARRSPPAIHRARVGGMRGRASAPPCRSWAAPSDDVGLAKLLRADLIRAPPQRGLVEAADSDRNHTHADTLSSARALSVRNCFLSMTS
jgi:CheY-like chemotaxis protein